MTFFFFSFLQWSIYKTVPLWPSKWWTNKSSDQNNKESEYFCCILFWALSYKADLSVVESDFVLSFFCLLKTLDPKWNEEFFFRVRVTQLHLYIIGKLLKFSVIATRNTTHGSIHNQELYNLSRIYCTC